MDGCNDIHDLCLVGYGMFRKLHVLLILVMQNCHGPSISKDLTSFISHKYGAQRTDTGLG